MYLICIYWRTIWYSISCIDPIQHNIKPRYPNVYGFMVSTSWTELSLDQTTEGLVYENLDMRAQFSPPISYHHHHLLLLFAREMIVPLTLLPFSSCSFSLSSSLNRYCYCYLYYIPLLVDSTGFLIGFLMKYGCLILDISTKALLESVIAFHLHSQSRSLDVY